MLLLPSSYCRFFRCRCCSPRSFAGFNNGSVYMYVSSSPASGDVANAVSAEVVQRTSMNTSLGAAAGGLTALLVAAIFTGE